ncbi:probable disease resistance protein At4g27220 isoform X2 [Rhododendron vialii]|nr:probable disease resistance protein At4g27220 isoform X2 [Rhododendron vialii]
MNLEKTPTQECDAWRTEVAEMENKIETIKQEFSVEKKCVGGLCPDIFARIGFGERVVNMINDIDVLLEKSKFGSGFLVDSPPARVEKQPGPGSTLSMSAYDTLAMVLDEIRDKSTPKIGIWGMGGVGKTTVLQLLNNTPEITAMFDHVIWVTISKSPSIRMIQEEVARRLQIRLDGGESDEIVARQLFRKLDNKKYLLLLDDVWEMVDITVIGLPNPNKDNGCKLVLTTRNLEVCRKMETYTEIKVKVLSNEEALEMFYTNVGDVVRLSAIKELAESIVKECNGLPLALKVVSGALRKEANVNVWSNFLRELRSPATSFIEDLNEKVFKVLKVSYNHLKNTQNKKCFLFCGLYPEDSNIKKLELIGYWKAEGILSPKLTWEEAHDKGEAILQALIDASLLEKCDGYDDHVKMHDVVRDLVLAMTSPEGGEESAHLVRAGISSEKMPEEVEWKKATRISFMDHDLRNLPKSPKCPELLTLLLQGNRDLEAIPETFFDNMPNLRVLDLSRTSIKSLPTSMLKLDNLRELILQGNTDLEAIPETFFDNMPNLRVLDLSCTSIKSLPTSMLKLDNLRELILSDCKRLEALPVGMIRKLSRIEVFKLALFGPFFEGGLSDESTDIVAKELSDLSKLSFLDFDFQRVDNLQYFLQHSRAWKQRTLIVFGLSVGRDWVYQSPADHWGTKWLIEKYKRCLSYQVSGEEEMGSGLPSAIEDALNRSNCFQLKGQDELNSLSEVGAHNTCELRYCRIEKCNALENVANRNGLLQTGAFPNLERLHLIGLRNLKSVLCLETDEGQLLPPTPPNLKSFTNLKTLELECCPRIEQLFSSGFMVQQLSNLEALVTWYCPGLKGMVPDDEKIEYEALPKLQILWLRKSPEFVSFFKGVPMYWPSLLEVQIMGCPKLRKLPIDTNSCPNLKAIRGNQECVSPQKVQKPNGLESRACQDWIAVQTVFQGLRASKI